MVQIMFIYAQTQELLTTCHSFFFAIHLACKELRPCYSLSFFWTLLVNRPPASIYISTRTLLSIVVSHTINYPQRFALYNHTILAQNLMASTDKPDPESIKSEPSQPPPPPPPPSRVDYFAVDVALRVLLFAATVTALVVLVTSKQTKEVLLLGPNGVPFRTRRTAKFNHSPGLM